jgi:hypothetical protein
MLQEDRKYRKPGSPGAGPASPATLPLKNTSDNFRDMDCSALKKVAGRLPAGG